MITVGSLFSGIGGFDLAFERAGCCVLWQVENDTNAQKVLRRRFQKATLYDDVRTVGAANLEPVDVIVAGVPCQDVSVAGKRAGLAGSRSGLFFEFVRIIREMKEASHGRFPRFIVMENVPGLLTSNRGRDFHSVLTALAELGLCVSWRIYDSKYFGVPQRRRRVFLVGCARGLGDGAAQVLFEPARGTRDSQKGNEARTDVAATLRGRAHGAGVNMPGRGDEDDENIVYDTTQITSAVNRSNPQAGMSHPLATQAHPPLLTFGWNKSASQSLRVDEDVTENVQASGSSNPAIAYTLRDNQRNTSQGPANYVVNALTPVRGGADDNDAQAGHLIVPERARALTGSMHKRHDDNTDTLLPTVQRSLGHHGHSSPRGGDGHDPLVAFTLGSHPQSQAHNTTYPGGVRRLTPLECERLQGFPDGHSCICGAANEYRALLRVVWDTAYRTGLSEREARRAVHVSQETVLQCILRTSAPGDTRNRRSAGFWSETRAAALSTAGLPDLWTTWAPSPQGREPAEQRARQHRLAMRELPHEGTLGNGNDGAARGQPANYTEGCPWEDCRLNGHTLICICPDSPRYQQLGNAVTVPVVEWIARHLMAIDARLRDWDELVAINGG